MLRKTKFTLGEDYSTTFDGYSDGTMQGADDAPLFTLEQAHDVATRAEMELLFADDGEGPRFFRTVTGELETYPAQVIDGQQLFRLGDRWAWTEVEPVIFRISTDGGPVYGCKDCTSRLQVQGRFPNAWGVDVSPEEELLLKHVVAIVAVADPSKYACDGCARE